MAGNRAIHVRLPPELDERMTTLRTAASMSEPEFVRLGIERLCASMTSAASGPVAPRKIERKPPPKSVRTTKCIHGQKPDQFCRRCDS